MALVLLAAGGLQALAHHDLHALAARRIEHLRLNPAQGAPTIFVDAMSHLDDPRPLTPAAGAAAHAGARPAEGWGLFHERAWAEWLAAVSGAIGAPFELAGLWRNGAGSTPWPWP